MDYLIPGPNLGRLSIVLLASVVIIQTVAEARRVAVTSFAAGQPAVAALAPGGVVGFRD